jgi:hypothetical protein
MEREERMNPADLEQERLVAEQERLLAEQERLVAEQGSKNASRQTSNKNASRCCNRSRAASPAAL